MRRTPVSEACRNWVIFSSPGQSSCLSMTQLAQSSTIFKITEGEMITPVAKGKSCNTKGIFPSNSEVSW